MLICLQDFGINTKICLPAKTGDYLPGLGRHLVDISTRRPEWPSGAEPHTERKVACSVSQIHPRQGLWFKKKKKISLGQAYFGISFPWKKHLHITDHFGIETLWVLIPGFCVGLFLELVYSVIFMSGVQYSHSTPPCITQGSSRFFVCLFVLYKSPSFLVPQSPDRDVCVCARARVYVH